MESLKSVNQHRPVLFIEDILANLHDIVWPDPNQVRVERGVMQRAQRKAVRDHRHAERIRVRKDMGSFKQFVATQPAHGTMMLIRAHYPFAKFALVQPLSE